MTMTTTGLTEFRKILLWVLCILTAVTCMPLTSRAAEFTPRLEAPDKNNVYYYSKNPFYQAGYGMPNCTAYAWGRVYEITGTKPKLSTGNAYGWYGYVKDGYARGQEARLGAVACWGGGGHVAVVEKIEGSRITISESSWGGKYFNVRTTSDVPGMNPKWQGYIYPAETGGATSSAAAASVSFSPATDTAYKGKEKITESNATVVIQINKAAGVSVTEMGLYLYDADGNLMKRYMEKVTNVPASQKRYHSWFDINDELGVRLSPGTVYKYQFTGIFNGQEVKDQIRSLKTKGTAPASAPAPTPTPTETPAPNVQFSAPADAKYTAKEMVSPSNAVVVTQITKPAGVRISDVGLILMDKNGNILATYAEPVTNVPASQKLFHSWFDINADLGMRLDPDTEYRYQFVGTFNGVEVKGSVRSFRTQSASAPVQTAAPTAAPTAASATGTPQTSSAPAPANGSVGQKIVEKALTYVGKVPYVWGGTKIDGSNPGADCSGFICRVYEKFGYNLWSNRMSLRKCGTNLGTDISAALPGDIIWYTEHVAIYAGRAADGTHMIVHENKTNNNVGYTSSKLSVALLGVIRIPGITDGYTSTDAPARVWFTAASDPAYTKKEKVTDTNAVVVTQVTKTSGTKVTKSGLYLYDAAGRLIKRHEENTSNVSASLSVYHSWFDINSELGVTLTPGTEYKYQFFGVFNGAEVKGDMRSFRTAGSALQTPQPTSAQTPGVSQPPSEDFYQLTFNANGGRIVIEGETEVLSIAVKADGAFSFDNMPDPVRSGYTFAGWYNLKTGGSKVSGITNMKGDLELYARWTENEPSSAASEYVILNRAMTAGEFIRMLGSVSEGPWVSSGPNSNQAVSNSTRITTGMVYHPRASSDLAMTVVLRGDVLGTGKLGLSQVVAVSEALQGRRTLRGAYFKAGDLNNNGKLDLSDLTRIAMQAAAG